MRAKVTVPFFDKDDPKRRVHQVGDAYEGSADRIAELRAGGYLAPARPRKKAAEKGE